jgi:hypothetical protein
MAQPIAYEPRNCSAKTFPYYRNTFSCSSIPITIHRCVVDKPPGCKLMKSDKKSLLEIRTRALCDAQKRNACLRYVFYSSFTFRRESGCHNNALAAFLSRFSTFVCLSVGGGESASSREKFFSAFSCRCAAVLIFELCGATTQRQIFFLHKHIHNASGCFSQRKCTFRCVRRAAGIKEEFFFVTFLRSRALRRAQNACSKKRL